jgi:site-specific DNA-methyltransferase (adenine-specific)
MPAGGIPLTSLSGEWATPAALFAEYDREFRFTLDVCASAENAKCRRFFDRDTDGLRQSWAGETCWMNPPYGRGLPAWIERAALAAGSEGATVVARTDVRWWHGYVWDSAAHRPRPGVEVRFIEGRIRFGDTRGERAPFPSVAIVFRPPLTCGV